MFIDRSVGCAWAHSVQPNASNSRQMYPQTGTIVAHDLARRLVLSHRIMEYMSQ